MKRIDAVQIIAAFNYDITKRQKHENVNSSKSKKEEKLNSFSSILDFECKR